MPFLRTLACLFLTLPLAAAAELNTLKGKKITGDLVSADEKVIVIKTASGEVITPLPEAMQLICRATGMWMSSSMAASF